MSTTTTSDEARSWGMLAHLSALLGLVTGIGFLVGPLVVYLLKKDEHPFIAENAREALNFQITMFIAMAVSGVLCLVLIGFVGLLVFGLMMVILPVIAGIRARDGETYRYPFTLRLV